MVLIERGSEVGGGDVRTDVGTLARIVRAEELADGRWVLGVVGMHRIRVERWLPDDPYPRAEAVEWPDVTDAPPAVGEPISGADASPDDVRAAVTALLRRAAALMREIGQPAPPLDLELADDPVAASYQAIALSPLGPMDRQVLLATPTVPVRWNKLHELLTNQIDLFQRRLAQG